MKFSQNYLFIYPVSIRIEKLIIIFGSYSSFKIVFDVRNINDFRIFPYSSENIISCNKPRLLTKILKDMFIYTDALIQVVIQDINYISRWSRSSSITVFWLA